MNNNNQKISTPKQLDDFINASFGATYIDPRRIMSGEMQQLWNQYNQAGNMLNTGNAQAALMAFEKLTNQFPDFASARYELARSQIALGENEKAVDNLKLVQRQTPGDPMVPILMGNAFNGLGKLKEEIMEYKKVIEMTRNSLENASVSCQWIAHKNIGSVYREMGELEESITWLKKTLDYVMSYVRKFDDGFMSYQGQWDTELVSTYLELGNTYAAMNDFGESEKAYIKGFDVAAASFSMDPRLRGEEVKIWYSLADLYNRQNQPEKMNQYMDYCIQRYPDNPQFPSMKEFYTPRFQFVL